MGGALAAQRIVRPCSGGAHNRVQWCTCGVGWGGLGWDGMDGVGYCGILWDGVGWGGIV